MCRLRQVGVREKKAAAALTAVDTQRAEVTAGRAALEAARLKSLAQSDVDDQWLLSQKAEIEEQKACLRGQLPLAAAVPLNAAPLAAADDDDNMEVDPSVQDLLAGDSLSSSQRSLSSLSSLHDYSYEDDAEELEEE